ncbi:hypothetical protein [Azospirillum rugosum]|uniref:SGNH/GDSL hydrolase family protein n=1 Tax=Azospirillum rugosum TaxID=416170 RepID=A0ABS4SQT9_9PROT|nr:hypothetical protein [Azospirillum rugosum]MBP2294322.1 hypothetical protein [Azospirillum rugosum]MDQ0527657.1 hypothetical protein [Azospirillum rugosum]
MKTINDLRELPKDRPLYIYGAGTAGRVVKNGMRRFTRRCLVGFVDSTKTGTLDGFPILPAERFCVERPDRAVVIIASHAWEDIAGRLAAAGIPHVYNAYPYVERRLAAANHPSSSLRRTAARLILPGELLASAAGFGLAATASDISAVPLLAMGAAALADALGGIWHLAERGQDFYSAPKNTGTGGVAAPYQLRLAVFNPYFGYTHAPNARYPFTTNNFGFKVWAPLLDQAPGAWDYPYPRRDGDLLVGIFGGSVAQGFAEAAARLPDLVERLAALPPFRKRKVRILNFALSGCKQPQQLAILSYFLALGQNFDVVINIDGFNEGASGFTNWRAGVEPSFPAENAWSELGRIIEGEGSRLSSLEDVRRAYHKLSARHSAERAAAAGTAASFLCHRLRQLHHERHANTPAGRPDAAQTTPETLFPSALKRPLPTTDALFDGIADQWQAASSAMKDLVHRRGGIYLHVLQPNQWYEPCGPYVPRDANHGFAWIAETVNGSYPRFLGRMPRLRADGVHVLDASRVFDGHLAEAYIDDVCHYTDWGYQRLFAAVGAEMEGIVTEP